MHWLFLLDLGRRLRHFYFFLGSHVYSLIYIMKGSQFVGLNELFSHAQKVIFLVGGLLHDVEESVLHDYFRRLQELFI